MNSIFRKALTLSILALFSFVTVGTSVNQTTIASPLPDGIAGNLAGGGDWGDFFAGVACGAGIAVAVGGYISGAAAPVAALMTAGILASCARALDL